MDEVIVKKKGSTAKDGVTSINLRDRHTIDIIMAQQKEIGHGISAMAVTRWMIRTCDKMLREGNHTLPEVIE